MKVEKNKILGLFVFALAALTSLQSKAQQLEFWGNDVFKLQDDPGISGTRVTVASYNLENLFDTTHDEGKNDYARLPKAWKDANPQIMRQACEGMSNPYYKRECYELDWSEAVVNRKIENLGRVIRKMNRDRGPDILVVEEVENIGILTRLRDQALADLGYQAVVLIEGPDSRGIDIGILSRFPVVDAQLHLVDLDNREPQAVAVSMEEALQPMWTEASQYYLAGATGGRSTRGVLEATFKVGNRLLTVFGNHWPSQAAPTEQRMRAAWTLYQAASKAYDRGRDVVALGDFNTLEDEKPHPFRDFLESSRNPLQFMDARSEFLRRYGQQRLAPGTHHYQGTWNFLDRYFVLRQRTGERMEREWVNFGAHAPSFVLQDERRPRNPPSSRGFIQGDFFGDLFDNRSNQSGLIGHPSTHNDLFGDFGDALVGDTIPDNKVPMRFDPESGEGFSDHLGILGTVSL